MSTQKKETHEIAPAVVGNSPADMIRMAVSGGADLEKLEKLLALQERWEANEAKKAYNKAMAAFKANPPKIEKDKKVAYKEVKYNHASLANVVEKISTELSKYGLSASWTTKQNGSILVTCKITHEQGHSEETTLAAPADVTGSKNAIQAIGSTITYLERYTLLALTGLATEEMEDDGQAAGTEYIDEKQLGQLLDYIASLNGNAKKFCEYLKVESLEKLPKADFQKALTAIESAIAKRKADAEKKAGAK